MSLLPSRAARIPGTSSSLCALLALLLLTPPGPLASAGPSAVVVRELRCVCLTITSTINPKMITNLQMIAAGPQCPKVEIIATLKTGKAACLDPEAPLIKKIIQKFLDRSEIKQQFTLTPKSTGSGNNSTSVLLTMSLRSDVASSRASSFRVLQVLLPLSLLLAMMVPPTIGKTISVDYKKYIELRCKCVKTISSIHPSNIQSLKVISPGPHCPKVEVIANLKNGKELCLDPDAPKIKRIVQKIVERDGSAA
ncbi:C-X-C motif chemokine 6 [Rousettus aegyptiacus]|nr:C-X-C motif chemokine 6 [Rousettus aegyptiacus]